MRESRRQQIMDVALELFAREGYSHTSISQLAKEAEISKGLMYNYFESKEALLIALIEDGIKDIMTMMDPNMDGQLEPEEVEGFIRQFFRSVNENIDFWILYLNVLMQPQVKSFLEDKPFGNVMEQFAPKMLAYFEKMGFEDPYLELLTLSAMIEGYGSLLIYVNPNEEFPKESIQKYEQRMIDMFTKKSPNN